MPDTRFTENVFCPNCGRDTNITQTQLQDRMNFNCPQCHFPINMSDPNAKPKPVEPKKLCPFRFIGYKINPLSSDADCKKEECGVWSTDHKCCGFAAINRMGWPR